MAKRRGWGWSNKFGFLILEVNGVPQRVYGKYGDEKLNSETDIYGFPLGTSMQLPDGTVYKYAKSGGDTIGAGMLAQNPTAVANEDMDLSIQTNSTIGDTYIMVTTGGAVAVDLYKDGYIYVNDDAGEGHKYRIKGNTVTTGAATMTVTLAEGETVKEAVLVTTSLVGLKKNPYNGVLLYNTTPDGLPRGVATTEVTTLYYTWLQTWGDACALIQGSVVLGRALSPSLTDTGALDAMPIAITTTPLTYANGDQISIAWVASPIAVDTDYGHVFLTIAP